MFLHGVTNSMPCHRYRESYSRDSLGGGRDGQGRVSVLEQCQDHQDFSYETLARNLDANLAEIDMDDFRSEDIHHLLTLPNMCDDYQVFIFLSFFYKRFRLKYRNYTEIFIFNTYVFS